VQKYLFFGTKEIKIAKRIIILELPHC
jgi:hypothetical protein